jgi:UDP-N-acetylglucosamine diphosphorylase / glucose-1-phosphate thymidylyltransferase / UDP-N-acetylgalactosamine diphosphorylase / glucosamine-1-phosphate N-acetyltransferase / galactosamine-1-phosphate N-acetyltransferase
MRHSNGTLKAVVLAAGKGVRLWPLTENRSKHMIPVAGKPIVEHVISAIRSAGIRSIVLVTRYRSELVKRHIGNGSKLGVTVDYVDQPDISGTASAISMARDQVGSNDFLVAYGDLVVTPRAIKRVVDTYRKKGRKPTIGLIPVSRPESYGMAKVSGDLLTEIIEKPSQSQSPSNLANTGIYVLNPTIFDHLQTTLRSGRGEFEITDTISSLAKTGTPVAWAKIDPSDWQDIGKPWDVLAANARLLAKSKRRIAGRIEEGAKVTGQVTIEKGALIRTGTVIEGPARIGEGAVIGPLAHIRAGTCVGKRSAIGAFCEVKNSIIMDHTKIPHLSYIGDSIIGEHCNLAAGTMVANLKLSDNTVRMRIKDSLVDTGLRKLGIVTGDNVRTGINVSFMPGIRIASGAVIPACSVVSEDVMSPQG